MLLCLATLGCGISPVDPSGANEDYVLSRAYTEAARLKTTVNAYIFDKRKAVDCEDGTQGCYAPGYSKGSDVFFYRPYVQDAALPDLAKLALHEVCHVATGRMLHTDPVFRACAY